MSTLELDIARARRQFMGRRGYLDAATYGLPSTATLMALELYLSEWREGIGTLPSWDVAVNESRRLFGSIVGVPAEWVSVGSQVSVTAGSVAASLPPGSRVVLAEGDFTSLTWPFLARPDLRCQVVPLCDVVDASTHADWVAVSAVQSSDGRLADLDGLAATSARVLLDATQAVGWLPIKASSYDIVTVGGYKWLCCPRGTTFTSIRPDVLAELSPCAPGWYAGAAPMASLYAGAVQLAPDARRLDVSPAWICWAGTAAALRMFAELDIADVRTHNVDLADRVRAALGLEPSDSAIVSVQVTAEDIARVQAAGVRASSRAGRLRLAPHLYNDVQDIECVLDALHGTQSRRSAAV